MTSECVRAESARKRTPRSRSPFETPVATTITSCGARSSIVKIWSMSSIPCCARLADLGAARWPELRLQLAAEAAQRRRGEDRLAGSADPDREMVVRSADGSADRCSHVAVLDQLDARARGADLLDQIVVARTIEHDRVTSLTMRPNASAIARMLSPTGVSETYRPRARGPTAILRMYMSGSDGIEPRGAAAIIEIAFVPPAPRRRDPRAGRARGRTPLRPRRSSRLRRAARRPHARRSRPGR